MKKYFLSFILLAVFGVCSAQFTRLTEGPVFDDPGEGYAKILQLKDYTTVFLHIDFNKAISVQLYEPTIRARTEATIEPSWGRLSHPEIQGIFEVNGEPVILVSNRTDTSAILYRLVIDNKTGKLKSEQQIGRIKITPRKKGTEEKVSDLPGFFVSKDPNSDYYAVATLDQFRSDTSRLLEISLYDGSNKEVKKAGYVSPAKKFSHIQFLDMAVIGSEKVTAFIYGYNVRENQKEGELIFADMQKTRAGLGFHEISNFSNDWIADAGIVRYDPQFKRLVLLLAATVRSEGGKPGNFIVFADPETGKMFSSAPVDPGDAVKVKHISVAKRELYEGVAQDLVLGENGGYTILFEEIIAGKKDSVSNYTLGNMAVVSYNNDAEVTKSFYIPYQHNIADEKVLAFSHARMQMKAQRLHKANEYKGAIYLDDGHRSFVVYNDLEQNLSSLSPAIVTDPKNADGMYVELAGKDISPKRNFVFGKPAGKVHHSGAFGVYAFDRANGIFITLHAEREGAHPGIQLMWLQP